MTVREVMRISRNVEGDVGIELEMEGSRLPEDVGRYWEHTEDGSLRGESCEYVLRRPLSLPKAREAMAELRTRLDEAGSEVNDSPRCGVHIHVNCLRLEMIQLYNFMTLYLILEDLLVKWCGPEREGNLFCLRAKDAEYLIFSLCQALEERSFRQRFSSDELRYASMNVAALARYGSLEFRAMRGTDDMDLVNQWATVLVGLRDRACEFDTPHEILSLYEELGAEGFLLEMVGEGMSRQILALTDDCEGIVADGISRAMDIVYCTDWEAVKSPPKVIGGIVVPPGFTHDFPPIDV